MSAYARSALLRKTLNRPTSRPNTPRNGTTKISNRFSQEENEGTETQLNTHDPYQFSQISIMEQNSTNKSAEEKKITHGNRNPYNKVTKSVQQSNRILSQSLSQKSSYQESNNRMIQMSQNSNTNVSTLTEENYFSQSQSQRKNSIISGTETSESFQKSSSTNSIKKEKQSPATVSSSKRPWMLSSCIDIINPYRRKRIKQQNYTTEKSESKSRKCIEYNDSKVDSSNGMNNALVVRSNNTSMRPPTEFKTPPRYNTHQDFKKTESFSQGHTKGDGNSHESVSHNNPIQERQILEVQHKANNQQLMAKLKEQSEIVNHQFMSKFQEQSERVNQQLMAKLQEQSEKGNQMMTKLQEQSEKKNQQLMTKLQDQSEYIKYMNRIMENQERKATDLENNIKNMENRMANNAMLDEENKEAIRNLHHQSQSIAENIFQILEVQKLTSNQLNTIRENDDSNLLDNIATNQVELSKKQDDLYRYTLEQAEKQKKIFDELSEKLFQSMKGMREFFDKLLNEKWNQVAKETKEVASTINGQVLSIFSQIEEIRKLDKSKNDKNTCITPPTNVENQYNDSQNQVMFSQVSATPETSNRSSMSSKQKDQGKTIHEPKSQPSKPVSASVLSKKKIDYHPKIVSETPVDDPNDIFSVVQSTSTASKYVANSTASSKKSITSTASKYAAYSASSLKKNITSSASKRVANSTISSKKIANSATSSKKIARPLKSFTTLKKKINDKMDPKIPKTVEIITNITPNRPQKQARRSKRLKQSSLVKKSSTIKKKVSIQVPEAFEVNSIVANKKPAKKVATKSSSGRIAKCLKGDSKKLDVIENSEDTFCFHSQRESPKKRSFMSIASPAALLSFFSPSSKKDEPPKYGNHSSKHRKKRRLNLNLKL